MRATIRISKSTSSDATGLPRGASRFLLFSWEREPPRPKAVASGLLLEIVGVATSVMLHGPRP
jgi:hypothetical protein